MRNALTSTIISFLAPAILLASTPADAEDYEALASEIARLRADVETLSEELDTKKETFKNRLRALAAQKATLEAEAQRESLRLEQLTAAMTKHTARVEEASAMQAGLQPAVLQSIRDVKATIATGLPFRVNDRIKDLEKLESDISAGVVTPSAGVSRLWSRVEDELRLGRENGMYQQVIALDGEEVLADVARVGMVMMYFSTEDGRVGRAVFDKGAWRFEQYLDPEPKAQLSALFEAMRKRVRVGFFELPNALPQALPTKEAAR